ncbi:MAG: pentapeptide repeat-containing protein [Candidatus Sericytochromatia bacterium]
MPAKILTGLLCLILAACTSTSTPTPRPSSSPTAVPDPYKNISLDTESKDPEIAFISRVKAGWTHDFAKPRLLCKGCDLSHTAALKGETLNAVDVSGSRFEGSDLSGINSGQGSMVCASPLPGQSGGCSGISDNPDWSKTSLRDAKLVKAAFFGADFSDAELHGADFSEATLAYVELLGAKFEASQLKKAILNQVYWPTKLRNEYPDKPMHRANRMCYHNLPADHVLYEEQAQKPCPVS